MLCFVWTCDSRGKCNTSWGSPLNVPIWPPQHMDFSWKKCSLLVLLSQCLQSSACCWGLDLAAVKEMKQKTHARAAAAALSGFSECPPQPRLFSSASSLQWGDVQLMHKSSKGWHRSAHCCRSWSFLCLLWTCEIQVCDLLAYSSWLTLTRAWVTPQGHHHGEACGFKWGLLTSPLKMSSQPSSLKWSHTGAFQTMSRKRPNLGCLA